MENTANTTGNKKLYLVSFGHSDTYALSASHEEATVCLDRIEAELNAALKSRFPEDTFAYYTTPRVTEVDADHSSEYAGYPALDEKAVEAIKKVLETEVQNMNDQNQLDSDAPFANVNPAAAGLTGII